MDLKLFFDPTEVDVTNSPSSLQSSIYINKEKMPDYSGLDIALIGLNEYRGQGLASEASTADEIRKELYMLEKGFGDYGVIDLGNFRNGPELEDTYLRLKEVCAYLIDQGILPVLFGGSHDMDIGQFYAYETMEKLVTVLSVDQKIDLDASKSPEYSHVKRMLDHSPNYLFAYSHLAYQSYLVPETDLELLESLSFESIRLGAIKADIREVEPLIRDADMLTFDISALQSLYVAGNKDMKVFGLTGEEACQICWYAGQNEKLSSMGIYGYDKSLDKDGKGAFVIGTMIWYFIEGFYHRKGDKNLIINDYMVYEVHLGGDPESIRFYKSRKSERWWLEVPSAEGGIFNRNRMIACNYSDYESAQAGNIPDRWINFFRKA